MFRRLSGRITQSQNDENNPQTYTTKSINNEPSSSSQQQEQHNSRGPRKALGVIPDNALNAQTQNSQFNSNVLNDNKNGTTTAHNRSKIPVLLDSQETYHEEEFQEVPSDDKSSDMDTSIVVSEKEENETNYQKDESDHYVDPSETGEDAYFFTNEPMSPIMNEEISNEIEIAYRLCKRHSLDPNDDDTYDISMVAEYSSRIFNYLHQLENKYKPNPKYIEEIQRELLWEHRGILMDWLVKLHGRFNLLPETLYLAVNIIDRFLSLNNISLSRYQLCGAVALFIAAKYEEINVPTVSQMLYMTGDQYPRDEFITAETYMVKALSFNFGWPGPMSFLRRGSKADAYDQRIRTMAKYFLEITIMDPRFVASPPSWLAAGAQYLARQILNQPEWTQEHIFYTGYTVDQLAPLADILEKCCLEYETHHKFIYEKYSEKKFMRCSKYVQEWLKHWAKE
ncbi:B-type cyclin [Martiniozyma asiatica (nom. inval.)]|nr:B-type cyclin [Martiniozyma asiatica]